jgi:hypothetical protein
MMVSGRSHKWTFTKRDNVKATVDTKGTFGIQGL